VGSTWAPLNAMQSSDYIALGWEVARSKGYDGSDFETNSDLNSVLWEIWDDYDVREKTASEARRILKDEVTVA